MIKELAELLGRRVFENITRHPDGFTLEFSFMRKDYKMEIKKC